MTVTFNVAKMFDIMLLIIVCSSLKCVIEEIDAGVYISVQYIIYMFLADAYGVSWKCVCFPTLLCCSI